MLRIAVKPLSSAIARTSGECSLKKQRDAPQETAGACHPGTALGARRDPQQRRGLVLGHGDVGRIQRKYHCSPATILLAPVGPAETPRRSQRERHLNVGQGGSPVPALLAKLHSFPTDHGLEA